MSSHHHHGPNHSHEHAEAHSALSEADKLSKMIRHWIQHNEEHAQSYKNWAQRAKELGREEVSLVLEDVAASSRRQNQSLEKALAALNKQETSK